MATAGTPAQSSPCRARPARSNSIDGAHGSSSPMTEAATADPTMRRTRPYRSDSALAGMIATASRPVVSETARADVVGETSKCDDSWGNRPCT
ncbi:Uncharacterised protein [Mycobacteroides abscessus subsp. abscessus]|nr:Uncharacterised protein [Mycobacteroides abscessus subsp. abscessus]